MVGMGTALITVVDAKADTRENEQAEATPEPQTLSLSIGYGGGNLRLGDGDWSEAGASTTAQAGFRIARRLEIPLDGSSTMFARRDKTSAELLTLLAMSLGLRWEPWLRCAVPANTALLNPMAFAFSAGVGATHLRDDRDGAWEGRYGGAVTA